MAVFHQIGNDSSKMLFEPELTDYRGAILSPVNYTPAETEPLVARARKELKRFAVWFDPQLYVPGSNRGVIRRWPYIPKDFDTADVTQRAWWSSINDRVVAACRAFAPDAICSPAPLPKNFSNDYYSLCVSVANDLAPKAADAGMSMIQTLIVTGRDLTVENRPLEISSIASRTSAEWIYLLVNDDDTPPRRELSDSLELEGILRLVSALKAAELKVMVGYSSSDMVLWKAAGADSVASGKFFNLRRFNRSRFDAPPEGGGQVPYWFEESLMAFVREADLKRLERDNLIGGASLRNQVGKKILEQQGSDPGKAWVGLSWRQYLWWLADCEGRLEIGLEETDEILVAAEANWLLLPPKKILMEEPYNTGAWLGPWRAALQGSRR
jgi:hypothetical protein